MVSGHQPNRTSKSKQSNPRVLARACMLAAATSSQRGSRAAAFRTEQRIAHPSIELRNIMKTSAQMAMRSSHVACLVAKGGEFDP